MSSTTESDLFSTKWIPIYEQVYSHTVPFNISIAVFILIQNSIIIADLYKDRTRIVPTLFMCIAASDMVSAVTQLVQASVGLLCLQNEDLWIPTWLVVCYLSVGLLGYACSFFYNTVLVIIKAIHMAKPFCRLNASAIRKSLLVGSLFLLGIVIGDNVVIEFEFTFKGDHSCGVQWFFTTEYWFLGECIWGAILFPKNEYDGKNPIYLVPVAVEFVIPCLIMLVCMVIQMIFIYKNLSSSTDNTARHANITVFMVSMLYFVCNGTFGIYSLLLSGIKRSSFRNSVGLTEDVVMQRTLPLLNAAIFPLIIILRKPDLRQKYKDFLARIFFFPVELVRVFCRTTGGSETLIENAE